MQDYKKLCELGFDIINKRKEKALTQTAVAAYCGVSIYTFQNWERGVTKSIQPKHFDKLKDILA